jgi:hypothetical protein
MMSYQVVLLDANNVYQVFDTFGDYDSALNLYDNILAVNFVGTYSLSPTTNSLNFIGLQLYVSEMTSTAQTNINNISNGCTQYCLTYGF